MDAVTDLINREAVMLEGGNRFRIRRAIVRPLIRLLGWLGRMDVDFLPWGVHGCDRIPAWLICHECSQIYYASLTTFNPDWIQCTGCKQWHRTLNDGRGVLRTTKVTNEGEY